MNYKLKAVLIPAVFLFAFLFFTQISQAAPPAGSNWELTFSDEFNGTQVDENKWRIRDNWCRTANNEIQIYNKGAFSAAGGFLRITASKTTAFCSNDGSTRYYQSGFLDTQDKFSQTYGYFEARLKVPKGKGLWPAWWMYPPNQWPPEIDITEILGGGISTTYMTYHWLSGTGALQSSGSSWSGPDFSQDFHIFAVDWEPGLIIWYVDGIERWRLANSNVSSMPLKLVLNLAVGGWAGTPDANTVFPAYMDVDYVRVYKKVSLTPTPTPAPASTIRINCGGSAYTDSGGNLWSADYGWTSDGASARNTTDTIAGTADDVLYQDSMQAWLAPYLGAIHYGFNVLNGLYTVRLHFAEIYYTGPACAGYRKFNIEIEGNRVATDLDVCGTAGVDNALIKSYSATVTDGKINIDFLRGSAYQPFINAIEIIPADTIPPAAPTNLKVV